MRVRYKIINQPTTAVCDMTEKQAVRLFESLKDEPLCMWAEMVAEDEDEGEYMDVLESFDHDKRAKMFASVFESLRKEIQL